jgi:hypothetical protein
METYPATDDRGWKIIEQTIDASDYYVVIVAGTYGSIRATTGLSWTEEEYEDARAQRKTILAFPRSASHITVAKSETQADRIAKHQNLLSKLLQPSLQAVDHQRGIGRRSSNGTAQRHPN